MLDKLKKSLKKDGPGPLYFLHGDEQLLIEDAIKLIESEALGGGDSSFNRTVSNAREIKAVAVVGLANTLPMLGGRQFICVRDAQHYNAAELALLLPYVTRPNPSTTLVMTAAKVDARLKFFKQFKKSGQLIKFTRPYENQIPGWIQTKVRDIGCQIEPDAARLMAELGGNDLMALHRMLEQLSLYIGGEGRITLEHVEQVVARVKVNSIFELCDAIGEKNRQKALKILNNMLQNRVRPLQMMSMIVRHYRQLWIARELSQRRLSSQEIAKSLGVHPFFVKGIIQQQRQFGQLDFQRAFYHLLDTDYLLKSSPLKDSMLMERLIFRLMGG